MSRNVLFTPTNIGKRKLENRFVLAPLTRGRAGSQRIPNTLMAEYYEQRSSAGLLISEATVVSSQGNGWVDSPGIYTNSMTSGWKAITNKLSTSGCAFFCQLWHCGRASHSDFHDGELPVSASAVKLMGDQIHTPLGKKDYEVPRALSQEEISSVVQDYKAAAQRALAAGFNGIEIHAANGYLINQFLDAKTNLREDDYGGSIENRCRLLLEILAAVTEIFPSEQVGLRISPNGIFNDMGSADFRELYTYVIQTVNSRSLAYLHVMDGLAFGFHEQGDPFTLEQVRELYSGTIIGNCGYDADSAAIQLSAGNADLIAFGRPFISNPDFVERTRENAQLNSWEDMSHWYGGGAKGYTDYAHLNP